MIAALSSYRHIIQPYLRVHKLLHSPVRDFFFFNFGQISHQYTNHLIGYGYTLFCSRLLLGAERVYTRPMRNIR